MAVEIRDRRLLWMRWSARAPRVALVVASSVLCAAGLRTLFARPAPAVRPVAASRADVPSLSAEAVATDFARAYLTWDQSAPGRRTAELQRLAPALADDIAGTRVTGGRHVLWTTI